MELWGIFDGLTLIQNMNNDGVRIQADSVMVIKTVQNSSLTSSNSVFIRCIRHLLVNVRSWIIHYLPRECNQIANCLAKMALGTNQGLNIHLRKFRGASTFFY
ncbi:hypothetical protein J1N35_035548 [Gossypium stocksii]|uniref:RNase H type-1 domain-containing protein n=1 Tax=Gossypium stocksii TaxID=47602 RepID=A0A9D3UU49_9ROSI|nr:hypothetical protein J1N35_035548 [Gossypium stocksii]